MPDTCDPAKRSWIMSRVLSKGTRLEMVVQNSLKAAKIPFTVQDKTLPGRPDIVIRRARLVVFVNGCFWHWHGCKRSRMPTANRAYWEAKIARNIRRDRRNRRRLRAEGWHCCTVWECALEQGINRVVRKIAALRRE